MKEDKKIRIVAILNHLKKIINPAFHNNIYQSWLKTNRKVSFRSYVINEALAEILKELDKEE